MDSGAQDVSVNGEACLHTPRDANSGQNKLAELVGSKCLLKCCKNGYAVTVFLDTGARILDHSWIKTYLPHHRLQLELIWQQQY